MPILMLLLLAWPGQAAPAPAMPAWSCSLQADLYGDAEVFLRYGRDSWQGTGVLDCRAPDGQTLQQSVHMVFDSSAVGIGVNESSWLAVAMSLTLEQSPENFQFYAPVVNHEAAPRVAWHIVKGGVSLDVDVVAQGSEPVDSSLRQGSLFLHTP